MPQGLAKGSAQRLRKRLLRHHLLLFGFSLIFTLALYCTRPYSDVLSRASFATAYPALVLLAATLVLGPWNVLTRRRNPVSSDLRRDVGIWAAILAVIHTIVGQNVHLRGRPWLYYVYAPREHHSFPIRHDLFGLANYSGAVATMAAILLCATSNDYSLRKLGAARWKGVQRWNYLLFGLTGVHAFAYQGVEKQKLPYVALVTVCIGVALLFQAFGILTRIKTVQSRTSGIVPPEARQPSRPN